MKSTLSRNLSARTALLCGASIGALVIAGVSPAFAQAAAAVDDTPETVTVTGTLLKGVAPVGTHIVDFSAADIQATGGVTTDQVLSNIPQISNLFNSAPQTNTGSGGSDTQPKPIIRNLNSAGGAATLILVDGHNLVGDGLTQTTPDPTNIPAMVLQRVDVQLDGGSAIYGSNAIAGIINLITRKDFEGFQAQTAIGTTGNYNTFQLGVMAGHEWGSGGAYLAYEYRNNSDQLLSDRPYGRLNLIPLGGTVDGRSANCPLFNVTAGATTYASSTSAVANTPGALKAAVTAGQNKCDTSLNTTLFGQDTQHAFFGSFHQAITDSIDFNMTASYSHHSSSGFATALNGTGTINNTNPYFQSINGETKQTVAFSLAPVFGNSVNQTHLLDKFYVVPDFDFKLGGDWDLDLQGNYSRSSLYSVTPSLNGVQATADLASSVPGAGVASMDPNFALDPYNLALTNPAVLQELQTFGSTTISTQQLEQVRAIGRGTIFSLPGGDVKLAAGAMYDYESLNAGNVNGPIGQRSGVPVPGGLVVLDNVHRYVQSVFGEVNVPIVGSGNEMPFVHSLTLNIQGRYDKYSDAGDTTNPKISLDYQPISGLSIRGNIGTSFNAPSMADKEGATDTRILLQASSTVRQPLSISGETPAQDAGDAQRVSFLIAGGSPNLQSQKANTNSFGFDYHPDFVEGLDVSLTKWHVSLFNLITQAPYKDPNQLYVVPAYAPYYIINPTIAQLTAQTTGIVQAGFPGYAPYFGGPAGTASEHPYALIDARRHNLGNITDEGFDFTVNYTMPTSWGSAQFGLNGSDYTESKQQAYTGGPVANNLNYNLSPYYFSAFVGGAAGPLTGRVTWNYTSGYSTNITGQTHVSAFQPVNLFLSYDLSDTWAPLTGSLIGLNITNLFDENPPFYNSTSVTPSGTANGSTLGRFFQVTLSKKF